MRARENGARNISVTMRIISAVVLFSLSSSVVATFHEEDASDQFRGMEGWTVTAVTHVDGSFHGCKFNQAIAFTNGLVLKCGFGDVLGTLGSDISPSAVIFVKPDEHEGKTIYRIKALIGNNMYDMVPKFGDSP